MKKGLSRRTMLRHVGTSSLAIGLPPLEVMFWSKAQAQIAAQRRYFVLGHWSHGVELSDWLSVRPGNLTALPRQMVDFIPVMQDLCLVSGLMNRARFNPNIPGWDDAHEGPNLTFLTGALPTSVGAGGPSIDQVVASALGSRSVVAAAFTQGNAATRQLSHQGQNSAVTAEVSPRRLFDQLFGAGPQTGDAKARENSILDFVLKDISSLKTRVSANDQLRLDEHFSSIRQLEKTINELDLSTCNIPARPGLMGSPDNDLSSFPDSEIGARSEVLVDLLLMAIRCDLSRVFLYTTGSTNNIRTYPFAKIDYLPGEFQSPGVEFMNFQDHEVSHLRVLNFPGNFSKEQAHAPLLRAMTTWKLSQLARLLKGLKATQVADGKTLLDQCVVSFLSEFSTSDWHMSHNLPAIVAGGGLLGGRHIEFPCSSSTGFGGTTNIGPVRDYNYCGSANNAISPVANLFLTMIQALGINQNSFADSTGTLNGLWI